VNGRLEMYVGSCWPSVGDGLKLKVIGMSFGERCETNAGMVCRYTVHINIISEINKVLCN
jgi:hypothetical protein